MAKSTVVNGPSFSDEELLDPVMTETVKNHLPSNPDRPVFREEFGTIVVTGGESSSHGNSLDQSSSSGRKPSKRQRPTHLGLVQTTENLSDHSQTGEVSDADSTDGNGSETEKESTEDSDIPPYDEWSKDDLITECRNRKLAVSGTKPELVTRLEDFDFEEAELESNGE